MTESLNNELIKLIKLEKSLKTELKRLASLSPKNKKLVETNLKLISDSIESIREAIRNLMKTFGQNLDQEIISDDQVRINKLKEYNTYLEQTPFNSLDIQKIIKISKFILANYPDTEKELGNLIDQNILCKLIEGCEGLSINDSSKIFFWYYGELEKAEKAGDLSPLQGASLKRIRAEDLLTINLNDYIADIKKFIRKNEISQKDLGETLSISNVQISKFINKKKTAKLSDGSKLFIWLKRKIPEIIAQNE